MHTKILFGLLLTTNIFFLACDAPMEKKNFTAVKWIDLTHSFDSTTLYWPNNAHGFEHHTDAEGITPLGFYYSSYSMSTPEHGGTHLDAPIHFAAGKHSVDEVDVNDLCGEAVVIDVKDACKKNRDHLISIADIESWEKLHGRIPDQAIVLFNTGFGNFYPDRERYFGTSFKGNDAIPHLHFPGIDSSTTHFLVKKRNVKALGLDTPSIDYGQSKDFKTHQILLGANKVGFENVANLDSLPATGIYVVALPMKIGKGSGAPLRLIAGISQ
jgi:kynurenine formamidase